MLYIQGVRVGIQHVVHTGVRVGIQHVHTGGEGRYTACCTYMHTQAREVTRDTKAVVVLCAYTVSLCMCKEVRGLLSACTRCNESL